MSYVCLPSIPNEYQSFVKINWINRFGKEVKTCKEAWKYKALHPMVKINFIYKTTKLMFSVPFYHLNKELELVYSLYEGENETINKERCDIISL